MIRGTTPLLEFTLPFDVSQLDEAYVTLCQSGVAVLEKRLDECKAEGSVLSIRLTQDETLRLSAGQTTEIQIRVRLLSGDALASNIIRANTDRILKDGVI